MGGVRKSRPLGEVRPVGPIPLDAVETLSPRHASAIAKHLTRLSPEDRHKRFGHGAGDESILRYVAGIPFGRDCLLGVFDGGLRLVALAHIALDDGGASAEIGLSVDSDARGRGLGARLLRHSLRQARFQGARSAILHFVPGNAPLVALARRAGMTIHRGSDGDFAWRTLDA